MRPGQIVHDELDQFIIFLRDRGCSLLETPLFRPAWTMGTMAQTSRSNLVWRERGWYFGEFSLESFVAPHLGCVVGSNSACNRDMVHAAEVCASRLHGYEDRQSAYCAKFKGRFTPITAREIRLHLFGCLYWLGTGLNIFRGRVTDVYLEARMEMAFMRALAMGYKLLERVSSTTLYGRYKLDIICRAALVNGVKIDLDLSYVEFRDKVAGEGRRHVVMEEWFKLWKECGDFLQDVVNMGRFVQRKIRDEDLGEERMFTSRIHYHTQDEDEEEDDALYQ